MANLKEKMTLGDKWAVTSKWDVPGSFEMTPEEIEKHGIKEIPWKDLLWNYKRGDEEPFLKRRAERKKR
jgi:hypothetical protein